MVKRETQLNMQLTMKIKLLVTHQVHQVRLSQSQEKVILRRYEVCIVTSKFYYSNPRVCVKNAYIQNISKS